MTSETRICPYMGIRFSAITLPFFDQSSCNFLWLLKGPLSIDYTSKIAPRSLLKKCTHFGRKMGAATTAAPYGFWATNPTKKLAHWVYLLGQPLSRNRVFQNFSGEPPLNRVINFALTSSYRSHSYNIWLSSSIIVAHYTCVAPGTNSSISWFVCVSSSLNF